MGKNSGMWEKMGKNNGKEGNVGNGYPHNPMFSENLKRYVFSRFDKMVGCSPRMGLRSPSLCGDWSKCCYFVMWISTLDSILRSDWNFKTISLVLVTFVSLCHRMMCSALLMMMCSKLLMGMDLA